MDTKIKEVSSFIESNIAGLQQKHQMLKADSREDEAVLCKVRINICEIYKNMLNATRKKVDASGQLDPEDRERKFVRGYLELMYKITSSWKEGLQAAQKANDYQVVLVEEIKLETAKQMEEQFKKVFGEP